MQHRSQQSGGFGANKQRHCAHVVLGARVMSNRNLAAATAQALGIRLHSSQSPVSNIVKFLRAGFRAIAGWYSRRRDRERLFEYLASDHRAAADIGYPHRLP
jgi:hypothetical protein